MKTAAGISTLEREKNFSLTETETYDILIIGGGIMGAGIALDAASRNLNILLVEKQDFAAGTSSRSTKLIHGGLRYLKNLEFGLVRTVARERQILHSNAPHLVLPEPMLLPVLKKTSYGYWATAAGLTLYEFLGKVAAPERHRMLGREQTLKQEPLLNPDGLKGSGLFYEYRTDDARLTLEVLKTAVTYGATCLNYCAANSFVYAEDKKITGAMLEDRITGKTSQVKARCVINAAGPWCAELMQQDQPLTEPVLFHTKGVHLVVPFQKLPLRQSVYFDIPGGRMLFAIPRNQITYLGTTDTPFSGPLENPEVTQADASYLLDRINQMFPSANLTLADVVSSWAGVRPLLYQKGKKPTNISRKDEIFTSETGLITVAGGKLTGYRHLAAEVVDKAILQHFPENRNPSKTQHIKLAAAKFDNPVEVNAFQETCLQTGKMQGYKPENITYLVQTYGWNILQILKQAAHFKPEEPSPENRLLKAEIWYTIHFEAATSLSDFLIRRTGKLYFEREKIAPILPMVTATFREILKQNEPTVAKDLATFNRLFEAAVSFKQTNQ